MPATVMDSTVAALLAPGKGLLAADESLPTIGKRFKEFGIPPSEENRRAYREVLFTTPGLSNFISGVILFDETIRQRTKERIPFTEILRSQGILAGIKVDRGTVALANHPGEKITEGLDGLRERLGEYYELGARFTKWRAVGAIGRDLPTRGGLAANARQLALFAALSQEAGLVPIVEPETLMDGDHSLARGEEITRVTLEGVFAALAEQHVVLEQMLLKTNLVLPGVGCQEIASPEEVATATLRCFRRTVPVAVPGIVFLSGGLEAGAATLLLRTICAHPAPPWRLSFSFGRALQAPALKTWQGRARNTAAAQQALHDHAQANSLALLPPQVVSR